MWKISALREKKGVYFSENNMTVAILHSRSLLSAHHAKGKLWEEEVLADNQYETF